MTAPVMQFASPLTGWWRWFAWYPVRTWDHRWRWLCFVERRLLQTKEHLTPPTFYMVPTQGDPMTAPTEAEERAAREWLACARNLRIKPGSLSVYSELDDREHRAVILRLLDRPVLPPEPSDEMLQVMQQAWLSTSMAEDASSAIYRALYAHLTRPRTKTVWSASYVLRDVNAKGTPTPYEITGRGSLGEILTDLSIIKRNWPGQVVDVKITHREVPL